MELLTSRRILAALAVGWLASACGAPAPAPELSAPPSARTRLVVEGRTSAHVSIAADGDAVALAWAAASATGNDIHTAVSTDGGATFGGPVRVNAEPNTAKVNPETPPRVAIRRGGGVPAVAVSWMSTVDGMTLRLARSADGGRAFGPSEAISNPGAPGNRGWHAMSRIDEQGRVALVWLDHRDMAAPEGAAAHEHDTDPNAHGTMDGAAMAERSQLFFAMAAPGGPVVEVPVARGVCYCCKTTVALAAGGRVDAAWRQVYPGNIRDIAFFSSSVGGAFGAPVRVSHDEWELNGCPEDGPTLVADPDGAIEIVWATVTTDGVGGEPQKALFHASSADRMAFTPREVVSTVGSPGHPQLARAADGALGLVWDELVEGARRLGLAVRAPGQSFVRQALAGEPNGRYPVIAAAGNDWVVAWAEGDGILIDRIRRYE